jgi:hypothetical protein
MIIRVSGDGQYRIDDVVLDRLNAIDNDVEAAIGDQDEERFGRELGRMVNLVRDSGERLDDDHLGPSDLILPPDDITMAELAGGLSTDGLVPD